MASLAGKTGLACFVSPYVALGRQVAESFTKHIGKSARVHTSIGGYKEVDRLDPNKYAEILVATPERFDAMLRTAPQLIEHLRCVVCDEAHIIENDTRGVRIEGLITRLRLLQGTGMKVRLVLLSAVLVDYGALKRWANVPDALVISEKWRPTARRLAFWKQGGKLAWYMAGEPIRQRDATSKSILGELNLPWPQSNIYVPRNFGDTKYLKPFVHQNVAYFCSFLWMQYAGSILCVCASKDDSRKLAFALAERFEEEETPPAPILQAIDNIERNHPFLRPLNSLLRRGLAYHNASLPHEVREHIEACAKAGSLKVVASTTTLAEGVDLPFRFTVLVDWLTWSGDKQHPMSGLLFRNIAGRCGRAGVYTEGDTFVYDNLVGDATYTNHVVRPQLQEEVFLSSQSAELRSALEDVGGGNDTGERLAVLASQFLASIPENPTSQDLVNEFAKNTLWASRHPEERRVKQTFERIQDSLIDETQGALARAASPLRLTVFGKAANSTGFSPDSCRRIVHFLRQPQSEIAIESICVRLLLDFGSFPEQNNRELRKIASNKRAKFRVKAEDISSIIRLLLNGATAEDIFATLPAVRASSIEPRVDRWLVGDADAQKWDEEFDKFAEFVKTVLRDFLPWTLRSCARLKSFAGGWADTVEWDEWAGMFENLDGRNSSEQR